MSGASNVNKDDADLDARAAFLIEHLRQPGRMQRFYIRSVEIALEHLEGNSPARCTRSGWADMLFAAMERRVERSAQDLRDWWALEGRAAMRAHVERVQARSRERDARA
jgi:hypothetical protein